MPEADYSVGSRQSFYVDPYYSPNGEYLLTFECVAAGEYCNVWSLAAPGPWGCCPDDMLGEEIACVFDRYCPLLLSAYGQENYPAWFRSSKLNILCYDIFDGFQIQDGSFIGGYFSPDACLNSFAPIVNLDTHPTVFGPEGRPSLETAQRVLVHEYTHLLTFAATGGAEDWLDEVIASSAEELCCPGSCIVPRIPHYSSMDGASMYGWDELFGNTNALYARSALFGQYLYTRFGSRVFGDIIANLASGTGEVSAVYFATGCALSDIVLDFYLAVLINDTGVGDGRYGFEAQPGYEPALYGPEDPYSALKPQIFTGKSCVIGGGGAIIVRPKYAAFYVPSSASPGLRYVGVTITRPSYTVDFYGFGGELISSQRVTEGMAAEAPPPPFVEGRAFVKWSCDISSIQCDTSVFALYALNADILLFDADCSGRADFADVSYICLCLSGQCEPANNAFYLNADADRNGRVEMRDASALYLMLCGAAT